MVQPVMTSNSPLVAYNLTPKVSNVSSIDAVPNSYASDPLSNIEVPTRRLSISSHSRRLSPSSSTVNDPVKTAFRLSFVCGDPQSPTSPQSHHRPSSGSTSSERTSFSASIRSGSSEEDLPGQVPNNVSNLIGHEFQTAVYPQLDELVGWQSPSVNTSTSTFSEDHIFPHSFPTPPLRVMIHSETFKRPDSLSKESENLRPSLSSSGNFGLSTRRPMSEMNTLTTRRLTVSGTPTPKDFFLGNAPQKDPSFEEWVARIQARARACKDSMSTLQRKLTCPSPPPQPSITGSPDEGKVSKEDTVALRTALSSLKTELPSELGSVLSTSSCSCATTACEISVHDSVEPRDKHSQNSLPDDLTISRVRECLLKTETGVRTTFNEVLSRSPRTVVIFIRFFWCALCQTYVSKLSDSLKDGSPARCRLQASGTKVILIGTGNWRMMAPYRKMLNCPFEIFTDASPKKILFAELGLQRTMNSGKNSERGKYLADMNMKKIVVQSIVNIHRMPFRNPGSFTQLGGEFCFESSLMSSACTYIDDTSSSSVKAKEISKGLFSPISTPKLKKKDYFQIMDPSIKCVYANRMTTSRDHGTLSALFESIGLETSE